MSQIQLSFPTTLPPAHVQARLNRFASWLQREAGIRTVWKGNVAYIQGNYSVVKINAAIVLQQGAVAVVAEDPGFLFKGKAEAFLKERFDMYLNPQIPLERLPA